MVTDRKKDSAKTPVKQGAEDVASEPNKINASTPYDFAGKNLTPYGGLLPPALLSSLRQTLQLPRTEDASYAVILMRIPIRRLSTGTTHSLRPIPPRPGAALRCSGHHGVDAD
jgi:hypothetical protein